MEYSSSLFCFLSLQTKQNRHILLNEACIRVALQAMDRFHASRRLTLHGFLVLPTAIRLVCAPGRAPIDAVGEDFRAEVSRGIGRVFLRRKRIFLVQSFQDGEASAPYLQTPSIAMLNSREAAIERLRKMHSEPVLPPWRLADRVEEYVYSSAAYYECNQPAYIPIVDIRANPS